MSGDVLTAILALLGTAIGTGGGIVASAKLTNYRIEQLEKKVDKHNNFAMQIPLIRRDVDELREDLDDVRAMRAPVPVHPRKPRKEIGI